MNKRRLSFRSCRPGYEEMGPAQSEKNEHILLFLFRKLIGMHATRKSYSFWNINGKFQSGSIVILWSRRWFLTFGSNIVLNSDQRSKARNLSAVWEFIFDINYLWPAFPIIFKELWSSSTLPCSQVPSVVLHDPELQVLLESPTKV